MNAFYNKKNGYSLVEMIIYIALISIFFLFIVQSVISFKNSYRNVIVMHAIDDGAISSMERMTRDIRNATSIDTSNSTFGSTNGVLTIIQTINGISTTTKFYLSGNSVQADVNGSYLGPLTSSSTSATSLTFTHATTTSSDAIKIDLILQATSGSVSKSRNYHSTIILKGS